MDQREGGLHRGIREIGEILVHLHGVEHAFVNQRFVRQAGDIPIFAAGKTGPPDFIGGPFADYEKFPLERQVIGELRVAADEHLPHERLGRAGGFAERGIFGGEITPADDVLALLGDDFAENLFALAAFGGVGREKDDAGAVLFLGGQVDVRGRADLLQKGVRHLHEYARAVAGVGLATARAPVVEVKQDGDGLPDDFMGLPALDVDDKSHAARVVFKLRVVKTLFGRRSVSFSVQLLPIIRLHHSGCGLNTRKVLPLSFTEMPLHCNS